MDDLIVGVVRALEETGVLDNTWIFYTSDHGQNLGHYRRAQGATLPFYCSTLALTAIGCHSAGIYMIILLPLLSFLSK